MFKKTNCVNLKQKMLNFVCNRLSMSQMNHKIDYLKVVNYISPIIYFYVKIFKHLTYILVELICLYLIIVSVTRQFTRVACSASTLTTYANCFINKCT